MPVEGSWERQQTPLRRLSPREARLLRWTVLVLALATIAVVTLAITAREAPVPPGCIQVTGGSTMGGANYRRCGADARRWCVEVAGTGDPLSRAVQARCRARPFSRR
jgi:hypothetical protein